MNKQFVADFAISRLIKAGLREDSEITHLFTVQEHDALSRDAVFNRRLRAIDNPVEIYKLIAIGFSPLYAIQGGNRAEKSAAPLGYSASLANLHGVYGWPCMFNFSHQSADACKSICAPMAAAATAHLLFSQSLGYAKLFDKTAVMNWQCLELMQSAHNGFDELLKEGIASPMIRELNPRKQVMGDLSYLLLRMMTNASKEEVDALCADFQGRHPQELIHHELGRLVSSMMTVEVEAKPETNLHRRVFELIDRIQPSRDVTRQMITNAFSLINPRMHIDEACMSMFIDRMPDSLTAAKSLDTYCKLHAAEEGLAARIINRTPFPDLSLAQLNDAVELMNGIDSEQKWQAVLEKDPRAVNKIAQILDRDLDDYHYSYIMKFIKPFGRLKLPVSMISDDDRVELINMANRAIMKLKNEYQSRWVMNNPFSTLGGLYALMGSMAQTPKTCKAAVEMLQTIEDAKLREALIAKAHSTEMMRHVGDGAMKKAILASDLGL